MERINLFDCIVFKTASLSLNFTAQFFWSGQSDRCLERAAEAEPGRLRKSEGDTPSTGSA